MQYDVFISHASEDKDDVARPLARRLRELGVDVWLDELQLTLGDSLRRSIEHGLANSKFGIVILSHKFFGKEWPQRELDGLVAKEGKDQKVILPIWHKITKEDVTRFSPLLADKLAVSTDAGIEHIAQSILLVVKGSELAPDSVISSNVPLALKKSATTHTERDIFKQLKRFKNKFLTGVIIVSALFLIMWLPLKNAKQQPPSGKSQDESVTTPLIMETPVGDAHSYSNPHQVRVRHLALDWMVDFGRKVLVGAATLDIERVSDDVRAPLVLDTRALNVSGVEASADGARFAATEFAVGQSDAILGAPLTIQLPAHVSKVRLHYTTSPSASGLQWLEPAQTAGKRLPFMFTQSQAIHARSWIPLQDTPQVRVTYTARVRTPRELLAVMSADNDSRAARDGDYSFRMAQPIPSYLIALAVGDLRFRPTGPSTGVYAEPSVVERAAREFADTMEKIVEAAARLYGPYRWGRYDILVLPPSFPFGAVENPRLNFVTPTVIAGDKSLVSLIAHQLAHSPWSGNLVTNATWRDFWLNEGFTTYLERRILEEVYGRDRAQMEAALGRRTLDDELKRLEERDEILHVDLKGRDPDEGSTQIPYEKGALFLRHLEETFGRERFDPFVRAYFDAHALRSITTEEFLAYLKANLLDKFPHEAARVPVEEWIERPGLPANAPNPQSDAFARVEAQAARWQRGEVRAEQIETHAWTTHEWLHFLKSLPEMLERSKMDELDRAFKLTRSGNSEVAFQWLMMSIRARYEAAYPRLEEFLTTIGRRKFLRPLYEELAKTPEGRERALAIYRRARPGYHPIAVATIDQILQWKS